MALASRGQLQWKSLRPSCRARRKLMRSEAVEQDPWGNKTWEVRAAWVCKCEAFDIFNVRLTNARTFCGEPSLLTGRWWGNGVQAASLQNLSVFRRRICHCWQNSLSLHLGGVELGTESCHGGVVPTFQVLHVVVVKESDLLLWSAGKSCTGLVSAESIVGRFVLTGFEPHLDSVKQTKILYSNH